MSVVEQFIDLGESTTTADPGTAGTSLAMTSRSSFPQTAPFWIVVQNSETDKTNREVMHVTGGVGTGAGSFTVVRSSTPFAHAIGSYVAMVPAAGALSFLRDRVPVINLVSDYGVSVSNSAATNASLITTALQDSVPSGGGRSIPVYLPGNNQRYPCTQIVLPSYPIWFFGDGPTRSVLEAPTGGNVPIITYTTTVGSPASGAWSPQDPTSLRGTIDRAHCWLLENFGISSIDGGASGQMGMSFPAWNGAVSGNNRLTPWVRNVVIANIWGTGIDHKISGAYNDSYFEHVLVFNSGQGFNLGSDSRWINCVAANNSWEGFYSDGKNAQLVGCKAWSNGTVDSTRGIGFKFIGEGPGPSAANLYAQDNTAEGFYLSGSKHNITAAVADRNGSALSSTPDSNFTVTIATPGVFTTVAAHGLVAGTRVMFETTGALPTGLTANTPYYVIAAGLTTFAFEVSTSVGGAAVNTSGTQSGNHFFVHYAGVRMADCHDAIISFVATDSSGYTRTNATQGNIGAQIHALKITDSTGTASYDNQVMVQQATTQGGDANTCGLRSVVDPLSAIKGTNVTHGAGSSAGDVFGDGSDGILVFDGTSTVLGLVPSTNVYTLTRDIRATNIIVLPSVTIKNAGYRIFALGPIVLWSSTSIIQNNGSNGAGQGIGGGAGGATGYYLGGTAGGLGGQNAVGVQATAASANCSMGGSGSAGSTGGTGTGGAQRVVSPPTAAMGGVQAIKSFEAAVRGALRSAIAIPAWSGLEGGTGGGGGGSQGTTSHGGDGGGGGGVVFLASREVYNSGTISANGGNGVNGTNGNGTGGGGGCGGGGLVMVFSSSYAGTLPTATKGTVGTGGTAGAVGTDGTVLVKSV